MYYQNYEDYMRSILVYPIQEQQLFQNTYNDYNNLEYDYCWEIFDIQF